MDKGKVIKALECCTTALGCVECPYAEGEKCTDSCKLQIDRDALALLEAQEPRVMTLDEVRYLAGNHEIVWAEKNGCEHCCVGYCSPDLYYRTKEVILWEPGIEDEYEPNNALYGKKWRCWTSRPTEEQREAVKWE